MLSRDPLKSLGTASFALHLATLKRNIGDGWRFPLSYVNDLLLLEERGLVVILDRGDTHWVAKATSSGTNLISRSESGLRSR